MQQENILSVVPKTERPKNFDYLLTTDDACYLAPRLYNYTLLFFCWFWPEGYEALMIFALIARDASKSCGRYGISTYLHTTLKGSNGT